jgi:uncharacterized coiled-coil protein SlyX
VSDGCVHCVPCSLERIQLTLTRMEAVMASEVEQLNTIKSRIADVHNDVVARLDEVRSELSPEGQASLDEITDALRSFDAEVGDADGSDTPPPATGDTGGAAGGDSANIPA